MKIKFDADNMQFELDIKPSPAIAVEPSNAIDVLNNDIEDLELELVNLDFQYQEALAREEHLKGVLDEEVSVLKDKIKWLENKHDEDYDYISKLETQISELETQNGNFKQQIVINDQTLESEFNKGYEAAKNYYSKENATRTIYVGGAIKPKNLKNNNI